MYFGQRFSPSVSDPVTPSGASVPLTAYCTSPFPVSRVFPVALNDTPSGVVPVSFTIRLTNERFPHV